MEVIQGGCLCGRVRYEYSGEVGPATYCHCTDCRRCTGSAFSIGVRLLAAEFKIVAGSPKGHTKRGDRGNELTRHFCGDCGSPLFTTSPDHPEYVYAKAGCLDDPTIVNPTSQIWTRSAVPWSRVGDELVSFARGRT